MEKKKILIISSKDGNLFYFRRELINDLCNQYSVTIVTPKGEKIRYFEELGCSYIEATVDRRGKNPFKDVKTIFKYLNILKKEKPDVVLTYTSKVSIYAGIACKIKKIPYIVNNSGLMHASGVFKWFVDSLYRISYKKAFCLMFQNEFERNYIEKILKWKTRFEMIPGSGVNLDYFNYEEYPLSNRVITFNYVGRIVGFKGIEEFLACAKYIKSKYQNTEFVVYGDFDDDKYRSIIENCSNEGTIKYAGRKADMRPFIKCCNAVIHPSHYEGMTNVVLEHCAMGRPALGSRIPGVMEEIEDQKTGFLFDKGDVNSLINAVELFLSLTPYQMEEMGKKARAKMEKEFSRKIVTSKYLEVIESVWRKNH